MMTLHLMGRQHGGLAAVGGDGNGACSSSIALLQERFRQLQKMREKREEMELLKSLSEPETMNRAKCCDRLVHHEMVQDQEPVMTIRSSFQDSVSLGLGLCGNRREHQPSMTPPFRDFLSMNSVTVGTSRVRGKPDVDTSLHL
ncbi:hypothetical protein R6Q57_019223 [Mikania cordata]